MGVFPNKSIVWSGLIALGCLLFIPVPAAHAQNDTATTALPDQLLFKHLSVDDGLSQSTVNAIVSDERGFVWIATEDGLNRYDGNEFRIFRHDARDSTSISHSVVYALAEDTVTNNLWIGTSGGLNYYNHTTESFSLVPVNNDPGTFANLDVDYARSRIWIAYGLGGIRYYDIKTGTLHKVEHPGLKDIVAWSIKVHGDKAYIGTLGHGLKIYDIAHDAVATYDATTKPAVDNEIRTLYADKDCLWLGTRDEGLQRFGYDENIVQTNAFNLGTRSRGIWSLAVDSGGQVWVGTDGAGLVVYSPRTGMFRNFTRSEADSHSLNDNTLRAVYIPPAGGAWLGTYDGGVNYYAALPIRFRLFEQTTGNGISPKHPSITAFAEDKTGRIWIGTADGLSYLEHGEVYPFGHLLSTGYTEVMLALCPDRYGGLWVGLYQQGLIYIDKNRHLTRYRNDPQDPASLSQNSAWTIAEDSLGFVWVGTDNGLNRFDPATRKFLNFRHKPEGNMRPLFEINRTVRALQVMADGTIWVGIFGELMGYSYKTDVVSRFPVVIDGDKEIRDIRVISLCEDQRHRLWIGTYGDGLCTFDETTKKFSIISARENLPNNFVLAIQPGVGNDMWMSTNVGLSHYDTRNGIFLKFDENYGVQGNTFKRNSSYRLRNGDLMFGGTNGFNIFTPIALTPEFYDLNIALTDFRIFDKSIKPGDPLLPKSITTLDKITLPFNDSRSISFRFSALHFVSPSQIKYEYKLEILLDTWQKAGKDHTVTFTSLQPGTFRFVLRASFNEQTWGPEKVIEIVIQPPWYKTRAARIALATFFALLTVVFFRMRTNALIRQKGRLESLVREQSKEIKDQNDELAAQNEELTQRHEEMASQREEIAAQNEILTETQRQMAELNRGLERLVQERTQSLDNTIRQLNKTIYELDAFVYSASHDLIAPLKSVMGLINLSRQVNPGNEENTRYLDYMEASIKKLDDVIKSMIQFSRNSKAELITEPLNLREVVEEIVNDLQYMKEFDKIDFVIVIDPAATVMTDAQRLKIIVTNLVSNAIKYADPTKTQKEVKIQFEQGNTSWKLYVSDNGIGIDKKYLSRVFEMFYRATERSQGSGLGLYIVKETVDRLNGEIFVDSEKGKWTRFELIFPAGL
ncbi:MAG TPA: two-component regulator propeller domain-containing protein [Chryseolinea sp.]